MVRLVREEGRSPSELAREFEPSAQSIMNWVAQAEIDDGKRSGVTTDEKAELRRLRAGNRVLRMEKDLLEVAACGCPRPGRGWSGDMFVFVGEAIAAGRSDKLRAAASRLAAVGAGSSQSHRARPGPRRRGPVGCAGGAGL